MTTPTDGATRANDRAQEAMTDDSELMKVTTVDGREHQIGPGEALYVLTTRGDESVWLLVACGAGLPVPSSRLVPAREPDE